MGPSSLAFCVHLFLTLNVCFCLNSGNSSMSNDPNTTPQWVVLLPRLTKHLLVFFRVLHLTSGERICCKRLQWTNDYSPCYVTFSHLDFSLFAYRLKKFSAGSHCSKPVSVSNSSYLIVLEKVVSKTLLEIGHSQLSVLWVEETYFSSFSMFIFRFHKLYFLKLIEDKRISVGRFFIDCCHVSLQRSNSL